MDLLEESSHSKLYELGDQEIGEVAEGFVQ